MTRVVFLDNLRYLLVLLVLVLHAAMSYSNFAPWWCVKDSSSVFFDIILLSFDSFLMPGLYFIAGFFTIASFQKHGPIQFIKRKGRRLGLPLLVGVPLISPSFSFLYHYAREGNAFHLTYVEYWMAYMKRAAGFHVGIITSIDQFSHCHLWFISLLLLFFICFLAAALWRNWQEASTPISSSKSASAKLILGALLVVGMLSALSTMWAKMMFASPSNPQPWVSIGPLLLFQPERIVMYALYFVMGIAAYYQKWFESNGIPGPLLVWGGFTLVMFVCLLAVLKPLMEDFSISKLFYFVLFRSFFCLAILVLFLKLAARLWNRSSPVDRLLARNSYHIYIVHFLIVILLQLMMAQWSSGSAFVKFGLVSILSILISCGFSSCAIRPYPKRTMAGLYAGLLLMMRFLP